MLYLTTGANGSGKTLLTLKLVKDLADKEGRPVCHNGRFEINPDGPLRAWKKIDIRKWQDEPDGTIFFVDECHNDFPKRGGNQPEPDYVRMLAEHRRRGFDFYLITQHPQNMDIFLRRLVGNPGWHRHLKRQAGASVVSVTQWNYVNSDCEKPGSGTDGTLTMMSYPKEVYGWYHSAELHTAKVKIPRAVFVLGACVLAVPALGYVAWRSLFGQMEARAEKIAPGASRSEAARSAPAPGRAPAFAGERGGARELSATEYVAARQARIPGLAYTAPAFDGVTAPKAAPYPAACLHGRRPGAKTESCDCYSQQATRLDVPAELCRQIAANGFFVEWQEGTGAASRPFVAPVVGSAPGGGQPVALTGAGPVPAQAAPAAATSGGGSTVGSNLPAGKSFPPVYYGPQ